MNEVLKTTIRKSTPAPVPRKRKKYSPRRSIRRKNQVVKLTEDIINIIRELNKATGGLLFLIAPVYIKELFDYLKGLYNYNKNEKQFINKYNILINSLNSENVDRLYIYNELVKVNNEYATLTKKYLLTPEELVKYDPSKSLHIPSIHNILPHRPTVDDFVKDFKNRINEYKSKVRRELHIDEVMRILDQMTKQKNDFGKKRIRSRRSQKRSKKRIRSRRSQNRRKRSKRKSRSRRVRFA